MTFIHPTWVYVRELRPAIKPLIGGRDEGSEKYCSDLIRILNSFFTSFSFTFEFDLVFIVHPMCNTQIAYIYVYIFAYTKVRYYNMLFFFLKNIKELKL